MGTTAKKAASTSIIGGADGPTSIFILGRKEKNIFKRVKMYFNNRNYKRKRERAKKLIVPGTHTMEETIAYMKQQYGAVEPDSSYEYFKERKANMKYSLIQRLKPELLGTQWEFLPPEDLNDKEALMEWHNELDECTKERREKMDALPDETFPTDYHLFFIDKDSQGKLEIELDTLYPGFSVSYSGNEEAMSIIQKDIYLYYGVSQEDIDKDTERYNMLLIVLSSQ